MFVNERKDFHLLPKRVQERLEKSWSMPLRMGVELKSFAVDGPVIVEGFANAALVDRGDEIMPKSCWDLKNYLLNPIVCRNHDWDRGIGTTASIEAKDEGLFARIIIGDPASGFPLTEDQVDTRSLIAQKILRSFSVGFIPKRYEWNEKTEVLTYTEVELLEISVVSIPMQQNSQFNAAKRYWCLPLDLDKKGEIMTTKAEDTKPPETPPAAAPNMDEVKSMLKENTDVTKAIKAMCDKAWGESSDEGKALKAEIARKDAEIVALKAEKSELETLVNNLSEAIEKA